VHRVSRAPVAGLAAACLLLLGAGCGGSSSKPPASARDFTCQEVKESAKKGREVAAQVVSDVKRVTEGGVTVSSEFANRNVKAACVGAKPSEKVYPGALRRTGVSAPVLKALLKS
jgi:hypothetical protein